MSQQTNFYKVFDNQKKLAACFKWSMKLKKVCHT